MRRKSDDPTVIIGAGINGLVAAAMLARKGRKVLVLERSDRVGGCMRSDAITLPGFTHDVMATTFVLFLTSPAYAELGDALAEHGLEFCHTQYPTAVVRPNGASLGFSTNRDANVAALDARANGDGEAHLADMSEIENEAEFLFSLLSQNHWGWPMVKLLGKEAWRRGLRDMAAWFGRGLIPTRAWLEANYQSPDVQALWAPWCLHAGLTPEATYSGKIGQVIAFALEAAGAPVVKGGAGQAAEAFRKLIEAQGGEVRCDVDVEEIIVESGSAKGVVTAGGERIAANSVIASVAPGQLQTRLLAGAPQADPKAADKFRHGRGNFQLHYALDALPEWDAEGLDDVALIHLSDGIDAVSKSSNEAERGVLPETPTICVGQPHRLDPTRCPDGKAILWLQIPDAPRFIKGDAAGEIETTGEWDEKTREAFADRIERILAFHIRNFNQIKLKRVAYSPADLGELNVNLVGGDPYGGICTIDQFFVFRSHAGATNHDTAVKGLHHIGASTHPGPGLSGGSGYSLAKRLGA